MIGYRVYYDKKEKLWKFETNGSEVGETTDFNKWFYTITSAKNACVHFNENMVTSLDEIEDSDKFMIFVCKECEQDFILNGDQISWYLDKSLRIPKRCPACIHAKKIRRSKK